MSKREVKCQYCNQDAVFMTTEQFYGKDYGTNMWVCRPCDAYVGTHMRTDVPKGTLANKELREWRKKAHSVIDPLWLNEKKARKQARTKIYTWIQQVMNISKDEAHIGMMNEAQCEQLIQFVKQRKQA